MTFAARPVISTGSKAIGLRRARTCYDHFAERAGVARAEALVGLGVVEMNFIQATITPDGGRIFGERLGSTLTADRGRGAPVWIGASVAHISDGRGARPFSRLS